MKYILEDSAKVFRGKDPRTVKKEHPNRFLGYILGCLLMFSPLFVTVYIKVNVISNGYKITELVHQLESLRDKLTEAEAELMLIENPKSLYSIAKKMGYDYPTLGRNGHHQGVSSISKVKGFLPR